MSNLLLVVSETFYSLQGEGPYTGYPAVFLRTGGCNLFCDAEWRCDTIEVWQKGRAMRFDDILSEEYVDHLELGAHLVITGGEPLLQRKTIAAYLGWFILKYQFKPFVEVETNGTIVPPLYLMDIVDQWNVSFKLSNSGELREKRINVSALRLFNNMTSAGVTFKVVIKNVADFKELINEFDYLSLHKVTLMPAGSSNDELSVSRSIVAEICKQYKIRYSDRLHIAIWNKKTGV